MGKVFQKQLENAVGNLEEIYSIQNCFCKVTKLVHYKIQYSVFIIVMDVLQKT